MTTPRGRCWSAMLALILTILAASPTVLGAGDERYTLTAMGIALAPNAGGQDAYGLRLAHGTWEAGGFSNQYLTAGGRPLSGATLARRFSLCDDRCWWQFFVQAGFGASTAGPLIDLTWGSIWPLLPLWLPRRGPSYVPALRLDLTTHVIGFRYRVVTWSYPLWAGIGVSF